MTLTRRQQEYWPCGTSLPIILYPAFVKAGRPELAKQLFTTTFTNLTTLLLQYPDCFNAENAIAWLCARTRCHLKDGLEHARRAVNLAPDETNARDTLAETLFQLGRREEAVAEMLKCIELRPHRKYFRRQLQRMQQGEPSSDPPDTE
jgi:thioredoxin-like negative regulator of GroEL